MPLGTAGHRWPRRSIALSIPQSKTHIHVIGVSGSGKSRFLANLYLSLLNAGLPATLIDPHGDLARTVLSHIVAAGIYGRPDAYERVVYLDLPAGERAGRFLPLNVLASHGAPHTVASNVKDAFHRAYPELSRGAPMFDTLVQDGAKVLIANGQPLTSLFRLLTDKPYRDALLVNEGDHDVRAFFRDQFDRLSPKDQADQAGAALRRAHLLTFAPVLKYSLGQSAMSLDFRRILDGNQSVIVNLALADAEARRLLGCLITVAAEQGALSRSELPASERHGSHHLILDEFSEFTAQSEEALARMLSQTRKFGLFLVMAHQTWSQASSRLRGALQNVGLEVVYRLGRADAEHAAKVLGRVDPRSVSFRQDQQTEGVGMGEQWERWVQAIQDLPPRQAFVRAGRGPVASIRTRNVPDPRVAPSLVAEVEARYLATYFRPRAEIEQTLAQSRSSAGSPTPKTSRIRRLAV